MAEVLVMAGDISRMTAASLATGGFLLDAFGLSLRRSIAPELGAVVEEFREKRYERGVSMADSGAYDGELGKAREESIT